EELLGRVRQRDERRRQRIGRRRRRRGGRRRRCGGRRLGHGGGRRRLRTAEEAQGLGGRSRHERRNKRGTGDQEHRPPTTHGPLSDANRTHLRNRCAQRVT